MLSRSWTVVPLSRIQSVDVRVGVFQRMFGLGTVSVDTVGSGLDIVNLDSTQVYDIAALVTAHTHYTPGDDL